MSERISSGNREADEILSGGFPKNSINIIMGQPGTGKTVFAEQLVFHNASDDRPILYITTLSEPASKVVKYLQLFSFFDEAKLGTAVHYEDIGARLAKEGIEALLPVVKEAIRTIAPKIIVIDSFKALHDLTPSVSELRRMLYALTGTLTAYETTVFLLGEYTDEHSRQLPEFAIADGVIQFLRSEGSMRDERFLRVVKLRGSGYLEGQHGFKISRDGLEVYPRLVSPDIPENYRPVEDRIAFGVPGLDPLIGGGLWRGSTTLLAGAAGAGKTTMALQFVLEGIKNDEACLYVNFQENPTQLARTLRNLGTDVEEARQRGLKLLYASPVELQIDSAIVTIFRRIKEENVKRVVVDAVGDLMTAASDPQRLHNFLYALIQHFTVSGVTSIMVYETSGGVTEGSALGGRFSYMSDNIILLALEIKDKIKRTLGIVKARGTAHDLSVHELEIVASGARIK